MPERCADGGLLVGTQHPLAAGAMPARAAGELVGCNHLACVRCGAEVQHLDGVRLARSLTRGDDLATLHAVTDLDACALLTRGAAAELFRIYFCRCHADETAGASPAAWVDDADWACAGH